MPPSLDEWLADDDEARFISDTVDNLLDLTDILASYAQLRCAPPYDPAMMLKVLVYAYSIGVTSSRAIEARCRRDIAFRWLSGNQTPDYRSLARFRKRHLPALSGLFTQVLVICGQAGLVKLGRVALDGTKLAANASKHTAMRYDRMGPRITELQAEVDSLLAAAEETDEAEDEQYGPERRGDEIPEQLSGKNKRLAALKAAKAELEEEARAKAADEAARKAKKKDKTSEEQDAVAETAAGKARPRGQAQRNFTDPEARIMKTNAGFDYTYNAQAIVDDTAQVIIAADITQQVNDSRQLISMHQTMTDQLADAGLGSPDVFLADAGYCSEDNLADAHDFPETLLVATGREKVGESFTDADQPLPDGAS